ncbi:MAG TPA: cytochrome c peroxidase [Saprospiraceae bacterium]|nr:cytochrome c peroxidase [Saprospiraceae bacterium]
MLRQGILLLLLFLLIGSCDEHKVNSDADILAVAYSPEDYPINYPKEFPKPAPVPDNPLTKDGVQLGRFLFYDPILSSDSSQSCSSCHNPRVSFSDNLAFPKGVTGIEGPRSSMSLLNVVYFNKGLFWDGRSATLEKQALEPVENPIELHEAWPNVESKLRKHPLYPFMFRKAFGIESRDQITKELAVKAIAQFERIIVGGNNSLYFKQERGEIFFNSDQQDGKDIFFDLEPLIQDGECSHCHAVPLFTANDYFNNGLDSAANYHDFKDVGHGKVSGIASDTGKFKAPSLINIELTAPYMHDGRFKTLEEVMEHYNSGGHGAPNRNPLIYNLKLTAREKKKVIAFLKALTDTTYLSNKDILSPF